MARYTYVSTATEAINAVGKARGIPGKYGSTTAFAEWWGCEPQRVSDWRKRGFPSATYVIMSQRLRELRIVASPKAWGLIEPPMQAAE